MGDSEASFGFVTDFGLDGEGRAHPSYFVFPKPSPPSLRRRGPTAWEEGDEVFAAFGVAAAALVFVIKSDTAGEVGEGPPPHPRPREAGMNAAQ